MRRAARHAMLDEVHARRLTQTEHACNIATMAATAATTATVPLDLLKCNSSAKRTRSNITSRHDRSHIHSRGETRVSNELISICYSAFHIVSFLLRGAGNDDGPRQRRTHTHKRTLGMERTNMLLSKCSGGHISKLVAGRWSLC